MNTATLNNNNNLTSTLANSNSGIVYHSNTTTNWRTGSRISQEANNEKRKMILYIDLMAQLLGIDMNFEKFSKMTDEEIKSFSRDLKIKKIIE